MQTNVFALQVGRYVLTTRDLRHIMAVPELAYTPGKMDATPRNYYRCTRYTTKCCWTEQNVSNEGICHLLGTIV